MSKARSDELRCCWRCGRNGTADPLDKHHIFGGAYRAKSEKLGLTVYLCHNDCHIFGPGAVHANPAEMQKLHEYGQRLAMDRFGWSIEDFRREFGKNYLPDDEAPETVESVAVFGFALVTDDAALPW